MRLWPRHPLARASLVGLAALAALIFAAGLFLASSRGRDLVVSALLSAAAGEGMQVRYDALKGEWPWSIVIDGLVASDAAGPWLEVRRVSIAWRPLRLLRGRLAVDTLAIDAPVMRRTPRASPPVTRRGGMAFRLPVGIALEEFRVTDGRIEAPAQARFAAEGSLRIGAREYALRLSARRTDGVDEHIELSALFREAVRALALDLDAVTTRGGIVAALLDWPEAPSFVVKAKGEGPASDWRLDLEGDFGDAGALALRGQLAWVETIAFTLDGRASLGARLSDLRDAFGERLTFGGKYTRADDGDAGMLRIASDAGHASLDAARAAPDYRGRRALSGSGVIRTERVIAIADNGYQIGDSIIEASIGGTDAEPSADLRLELSNLGLQTRPIGALAGKLALAVRTLPTGRALVLDGEGTASGIGRLAPAAWSIAGHYATDGRHSELTRFELDAAGLSVRAGGVLRQAASHFEAELVSRNLEALSSLVGMGLSGSGRFEAQGRRATARAPWTVALAGSVENGVVADMPLAAFAGERLEISARATFDRDGALDIHSAELRGDHIRARARGRFLPVLSLKAALDTDLAAIGMVADFVATGPVTINVDAQGSRDAPVISLAAESSSATIEELAVGDLALTFNPRPGQPFPAGLLRLQSKGEFGAADLSAPLVRTEDGSLRLDPLGGTAFGARVEGMLALSADQDFTGRIEARFAALGPMLSLVLGEDIEAQGRGALAVDFGAEPSVQAKLAASGVEVAGVATANAVQARYARADRADTLIVEARAGAVTMMGGNPLDFSALSLSMQGPSSTRRVLFDAEGLGNARGMLKLAGTLQSAGSARRFTLEQLDADLWETPIHLVTPTILTKNKSGLALGPARLSIGAGEAKVEFARTEKSIDAELELVTMPLAIVGNAFGLDWRRGALEGTLLLSTAAAHPEGALDLRIVDLAPQTGSEGFGGPLDGYANATWDGRILTLSAEVASAGAGSAALEARLPLVSDRKGALDFAGAGRLEGAARWTGRVGSLWALLPVDNHRFDGEGQLTLRASGTWRAPRLQGSLRVTEATYDNLVTGTRLVGLDLKVDADADEMRLAATANDGRNGRLSGSGKVMLVSGRGYPMDANVELAHFRIMGLDDITATASGAATLSGPLRGLALQGALTLERVDATIPDRLAPSVPNLPVTYVGMDEDAARERERIEKESAVALDVAIDIPGRAYLRGRGLNAEWAGELALTGTTAVPRIDGEIGLVRGTLDFAGNVFDLSRGRVIFRGGEEIDPELDVAATRNVQGSEVSLAVTGPASAPKLEIQSVPALPQDQAVALLLFGKLPGELSAFELIQVARGVATLTGAGSVGGVGILGRTREALGLDVLSVGVGEMGATPVSSAGTLVEGATISAGRYISDKVYVGVTQGISAATGAIELQVQVTPRISVNTELGEASGGAAGLDWRWDY